MEEALKKNSEVRQSKSVSGLVFIIIHHSSFFALFPQKFLLQKSNTEFFHTLLHYNLIRWKSDSSSEKTTKIYKNYSNTYYIDFVKQIIAFKINNLKALNHWIEFKEPRVSRIEEGERRAKLASFYSNLSNFNR